MFVKHIKCRCEYVQEWINQSRNMNLFPKVLAIYTFPDNGENTVITVL